MLFIWQGQDSETTMFLRIVRAAGGGGVKREYVRVVEAYRERGKTRHRTVLNLGRKDLLAAHLDLDKLMRLLHGEAAGEPAAEPAAELAREPGLRRDDIAAVGAWDFGPLLAARHLWGELGLAATLDRLAPPNRRDRVALSDRVLVLVANRLVAPCSEHGLARFLESDFVCDRHGRRFVPAWRDDAVRQASRSPRVRVQARQLQGWYRCLDALLAHKDNIEHALFLTLRDLFSLQVDMVFYDLTSTYFEGAGPPDIGAHGHSRDGKPRNAQVLVGLVMVDGWPIAHHVFAGNWRDAKTVPHVLRDLEARFGIRRIVFVGDRGMTTSHNLADLREHGHGYIVGRNRRRSGEVFDYIQSATGPWIECPAGITAREKSSPPKTLVQEVASNQTGVRVFVVHSDERLAYERKHRLKAMRGVRSRLEMLAQRIAKGRLKAPDKIGAAAAKTLSRNHGHRYYGWSYENAEFSFFEHPVHFAREQAYEGKYVIQTEEQNLSAADAVRLYKELSDVERAFACLKDVIDMRPIYHHTDARVQAHIFVAAIAFLIHRAIENKLKAGRLDISATEALTILKSVRVVDINLGDGTTKRTVTTPTPRAAAVLRALGITHRDPPTPMPADQTIM
jgi:transposase